MTTWTWRNYWKNDSVWSQGRGRDQWMVLCDDVRVSAAIDTQEEAQFIVDACNAAEKDRAPTEVGSLMQAMVAEARKTT